MIRRPAALLLLVGAALAGCTTTGPLPPTEVVRYHLASPANPLPRGSISVQPLASGPASIEFKSYAAAVESELLRVGYTLPPPGGRPDFVATVDFRRTTSEGPPRQSPVSIGLGGGSFSGGRHGGVGLGGGLSFPIGGRRRNEVLVTELRVTIARPSGANMGQVWDGTARAVTDIKAPDATAEGQGRKLAGALFTGFPGESGRTIEVR